MKREFGYSQHFVYKMIEFCSKEEAPARRGQFVCGSTIRKIK